MSKIKVMDEILANKIAAGEVVEKTMNVVKELVENSIDANSSEILELEDGWTIVTEDGSLAAHYENTILITENEPKILTML